MKYLYIFLFLVTSFVVYSQSPAPSINYQGVARNSAGVPIVGTIGVNFNLHQGSSGGTIVFTEPHTVATNSFGIFNLQIGSVNTAGFPTIDWSQGPYFLEVSIDPNGGSSYTSIGVQQLVSVPYALYAEKAKNAATTTITATPNVTVTNLGVNNYSLAVPNYIAGSNVTITPSASNNYIIDVSSPATLTATSLWTSSLNNVYLVTNNDQVGIGTVNPTAKLEVNTGAFNSLDGIYASTGTGNGVIGSVASTSTLFAGVKGLNSGTGAGVYGLNSSSAPGVYGENVTGSASSNAHGVSGKTNSQGATTAGVFGENDGAGPAVYGFQSNGSAGANANGVFGISNSPAAAGVQGVSNGGNAGVTGIITSAPNSANANGVYGKTNATSPIAAGVRGDNNTLNGGSGLYGTTNSTIFPGVYGENFGNGDGIYGKVTGSNPAIVTAGVHGNNYGSGYGVYGIATSSLNYLGGVYGNNTGGGNGVIGNTGSTDVNAAGVYGINNGAGPGVKASVQTGTVAGGLNLSLLLENGHLRSTQPNPPPVSTFTTTGGATVVSYTIVPGSTDVKGGILAACSTTGSIVNGGFIIIKVSFNKGYTINPTVVITPTSDFVGMSYFISGITNTYFYLTIKNGTSLSIFGNPLNFNFNYFVIE